MIILFHDANGSDWNRHAKNRYPVIDNFCIWRKKSLAPYIKHKRRSIFIRSGIIWLLPRYEYNDNNDVLVINLYTCLSQITGSICMHETDTRLNLGFF